MFDFVIGVATISALILTIIVWIAGKELSGLHKLIITIAIVVVSAIIVVWIKLPEILHNYLDIYNGKTITEEVKEDKNNSSDNKLIDLEKRDSSESKKLSELDYLTKSESYNMRYVEVETDIVDSFGNIYSNGILFGENLESCDNYIEYLNNREYDYIEGIIVLGERQKHTLSESIIRIYADNMCVYTSPIIVPGLKPEKYKANISGCNIIRFEQSIIGGMDYTELCVVDSILYTENYEAKNSAVSLPETDKIDDILYLKNTDYLTKTQNFNMRFVKLVDNPQDTFDNLYEFGIAFCENSEDCDNYIEYYNGSQYQSLSGKIILEESFPHTTSESYIRIYVDEILTYTSPAIKPGVSPEDFELDITGSDIIRFEQVIVNNKGMDYIIVCIVDPYFR